MNQQEILNKIEDLTRQKNEIYKELCPLTKKLRMAKTVYEEYRKEHWELSKEFTCIDKHLAMMDGRYKKLDAKKKKVKKLPFSRSEVLNLAKALGLEKEVLKII